MPGMKFREYIYLFAIILLFAATCPILAKDDFLALTGATLIDGNGGSPLEDSLIIIKNDHIVAVGKVGDFEIPSRARIIDLEGYTILPGFINSHVHGSLNKRYLRKWAFEGVTTVRDLGANTDALLDFQSSPRNNKHARLVAAGPMISVRGGYPIVPFGANSLTLIVKSVSDARKKVEKLLDRGVDVIKIARESRLNIPVLSRAESRMIVRTAHGRGTRVSAHAMGLVDLDIFIEADVDDIAHGVIDGVVSDRTIASMVKNDIYWVPTLELIQLINVQGALNTAQTNLEKFVDAGGKVAMGTDFFGYAGDWELGMMNKEIDHMEDAGMTPMQIIVSATKNAAYVCNMERDLGTLEKGKIADILVVDGNPLKNMDRLANSMTMVIHNGEIIRDERP